MSIVLRCASVLTTITLAQQKLVASHPKNGAYTELFASLSPTITDANSGGWGKLVFPSFPGSRHNTECANLLLVSSVAIWKSRTHP
jgi:hypothetical protein